MSLGKPVFSVRGVTVSYLDEKGIGTTVVSDAGFEVAEGAIVGLAGESGSGKSTLALASLGVRPVNAKVHSGEAVLDGVDLMKQPTSSLRTLWGRRIAYVPQNAGASLSPSMRIGR